MSEHEARQYVDFIIEALAEAGKISQQTYGNMTEDFQQGLAEKLKEFSEN